MARSKSLLRVQGPGCLMLTSRAKVDPFQFNEQTFLDRLSCARPFAGFWGFSRKEV